MQRIAVFNQNIRVSGPVVVLFQVVTECPAGNVWTTALSFGCRRWTHHSDESTRHMPIAMIHKKKVVMLGVYFAMPVPVRTNPQPVLRSRWYSWPIQNQ